LGTLPEPTEGRFELVSEFVPRGDQPKAIDQLVAGINAGLSEQVRVNPQNSMVDNNKTKFFFMVWSIVHHR